MKDKLMQKFAAIKPVKKQVGPDGRPVHCEPGAEAPAPEAGLPAVKHSLVERARDALAHAGKDGKKLTLKDLMFENDINPLDLEYMSEADAAIHRYGKPRAYLISLAIIGFFVVMVFWAALTNLDEITRAYGQVVPAQAIQEIQYFEGGVLEKMMVKQGDTVEAGQVLARISNVLAESTLQEQKDNQALLEAEVMRLRAERDGTDLVFPDELAANYPEIARGQMNLFNTHREQRDGELRSLEAELEQRRREVEEGLARQRSLRSNLALAKERVDLTRPLFEKGTFSRMDFSKLEQEANTLEGELAATTQAIERSRGGVAVAEERINSRRLEWQTAVYEDLNKKSAALSSVTTLLTARGDAVHRTDLRSRVRGKVKRILINTEGGSVSPGATIMEILPIDEQLLIEARVSPSDRAFLHTADDPAKKQRAVVKITSYDYSIYGGLDATLESISDDTFEDNRGDIYYEIKLLTTRNAILYNGVDYEILPGMTAQVDIITGKKTVLSYLLKPILKAKQNALREH